MHYGRCTNTTPDGCLHALFYKSRWELYPVWDLALVDVLNLRVLLLVHTIVCFSVCVLRISLEFYPVRFCGVLIIHLHLPLTVVEAKFLADTLLALRLARVQ